MNDSKHSPLLLAKLKPSAQTAPFLEDYQNGGMSVVVIDTRGMLFSKTYTPEMPKKHPKANLYYTLNTINPEFTGTKPRKTDITFLRGWAADIDPDPDLERTPNELLFKKYHISTALKHKDTKMVRRLAGLLQETVHPVMEGKRGLPPSLMVFSGRGVQLIWYADKAYEATPEKIEEWEGLSRSVIAIVGGDAVQNVDRLLRLPGTINTKTGLFARIMWENDISYSPEQILSAFGEPPMGADTSREGVDPAEFKYVDWDSVFSTTELLDLDDVLIERFNKDLKMNTDIAGLYAGNPLPNMRDTSGSSFDMNLIGALKRQGYSYQEAFQLIMTYPHGSGYKYAEKRSRRYYMRCWARGYDTSPQSDFANIPLEEETKKTTPVLTHRAGNEAEDDIRDNFLFVASANKVIHTTSGKYFELRGFDNKFSTTHTGQKGERPFAHKALISSGRQADTVTWAPGKKQIFKAKGLNCFNMYRAHRCAAVEYTKASTASYHRALHHVIPSRVLAYYFLDWCAFLVQFPEVKLNHHPLMFSVMEGVGKDTLIDPVRFAIGQSNSSECTLKELMGDFNAALKYKKLIIINEVEAFKGGKEAINMLKPLLAAPPETLTINVKFEPVFEQPNLFGLIMTSNSPRPIYVASVDRRLVIIHCIEARMTPTMATEIWDWLKYEGGRQLMHYELLHRDVSHFNPNVRPTSEGIMRDHRDMQYDSKSSTEMMVSELIGSRVGMFDHDVILGTDLLDFCAEKRITSLPVLQHAIATAGGIQLRRKSVKHDDGKVRKHNFWVIRDHDKYVIRDENGVMVKRNEMSYGEMYKEATGITEFYGNLL